MRARLVALAAGALALGVALVLVRGEPRVWGDSGIFLTVGARLLDGDRLYADVADNKDPLFYYTYAAALWGGGWRAPFALDGLWLAAGAFGLALALRELRAGMTAVVAGLGVYPLALTAAWYEPGTSMLPGLALAPWALYLWARGNLTASGAVVGVSLLFKANLALVGAAPLAALLALGVPSGRRVQHLGYGALGFGLAVGLAAAFLAARGELSAYLEVLEYNRYYSQAGLVSQSGSGGVLDHLELVRDVFRASGRWQWPAAVLAACSLVVLVATGWRRHGRSFQALGAVAIATLAATVVTLGLTALFREHLQMLSYPAALGVAVAVSAASGWLDARAAVAVAAACALFAGWSSLKHEDLPAPSLRAWSAPSASIPALALEEARERFFPRAEHVPYVVFGRNTEDGHAAFVDDALSLECRWFVQYPFYRDEQFAETLECARTKDPQLVLVTTSLYDPMQDPRWTSFVARVRRLLDEEYELVHELGMSQVWKRR